MTDGDRLNRPSRQRESGLDGLLVIDKPLGLTSHDVVARVRRLAATRRVGHTGTLDPMATGVLVLCLGKATRLIPYIEETGGAAAKEYEARIRFGFETTTDDSEGEPRTEPVEPLTLSADRLSVSLSSLLGEIHQVPPAFSAKKVDGERAYALARRGEDVDLKPVTVHVGAAELLELGDGHARVRFACSRGTYVRALARDLGRSLGIGAHLVALRRTRSGAATLDRAVRLEDLASDTLAGKLVPMMSILDSWPSVVAGQREAADLRLGRAITLKGGGEPLRTRVRVGDAAGGLLALAHLEDSRVQPFCVF